MLIKLKLNLRLTSNPFYGNLNRSIHKKEEEKDKEEEKEEAKEEEKKMKKRYFFKTQLYFSF